MATEALRLSKKNGAGPTLRSFLWEKMEKKLKLLYINEKNVKNNLQIVILKSEKQNNT
jgi:hypothetical protein